MSVEHGWQRAFKNKVTFDQAKVPNFFLSSENLEV